MKSERENSEVQDSDVAAAVAEIAAVYESQGWYNPVETEKIIRPLVPGHEAAHQRSIEKSDELFGAAVVYVLEVEKEVREMQIAKRFRTDKGPNYEYMLQGNASPNPLYVDLSEAEFKRSQLLNDLDELKQRIIEVAGSFQSVIMDIEATKAD